MQPRLRIVSVCRTLPNPDDPSGGVFVLHRLKALAQCADVTVIQPVPYAPGLRPLPRWATAPRRVDGLEITIPPKRGQEMPALKSTEEGTPILRGDRSAFAIATLTAQNARLTILPGNPQKNRAFSISTRCRSTT